MEDAPREPDAPNAHLAVLVEVALLIDDMERPMRSLLRRFAGEGAQTVAVGEAVPHPGAGDDRPWSSRPPRL